MDESCKRMLTKRCIQEVYTTGFHLFRVQKQVEKSLLLKVMSVAEAEEWLWLEVAWSAHYVS